MSASWVCGCRYRGGSRRAADQLAALLATSLSILQALCPFKMAKTLQLLLVVLAATAVVAEDLPALPLFPSLPDPCGRVTQVQSDDTCDSMA